MEDRALTLDDTQGMFLLLGAGFLAGAASLFSEWVGGCFRCCKSKKTERRDSIISNPRWHNDPTPRDKLNSIQDSNFVIENYLVNLRKSDGSDNKCELQEDDEGSGTTAAQIENNVDYDREIDKLFDFGHLFGEPNAREDQTTNQEEIIEQNQHTN